MPPLPPWLPITKPSKRCARYLNRKDSADDRCLPKADKAPHIDIYEVARDESYLVNLVGKILSGNHAASYFINHGDCQAWNYDSKCIEFDAYNPVYVAHRFLPLGTVLKIKNLNDPSKELLAVVTTRGPYVDGKQDDPDFTPRDFDLSKAGMAVLSGGNFREGVVMPIQVEIMAMPRRALEQCNDPKFQEEHPELYNARCDIVRDFFNEGAQVFIGPKSLED